MADMSDYMETGNYDFWFRPAATAPTRPTSHVVSLWSAVTSADAGTGTELTGGTAPGYVRTGGSALFGPSVDGVGGNVVQILFPINSGGSNWPAITHYGIHDHLGNLLQRLVPLQSPLIVPPGQRAVMEVGDIQLTFL
jgi:hypothetical protein